MPEVVIDRAKDLVAQLASNDLALNAKSIVVKDSAKKKNKPLDEVDMGQLSLFDTVQDDDILSEIKDLNISAMTPIEALNKLNEIQRKILNRW